MRKLFVLSMMIMVVVGLSSCAAENIIEEKTSGLWNIVDPYINEYIVNDSGISESEEYELYCSLLEDGSINANNEYSLADDIRAEQAEMEDQANNTDGEVRVVFGNNNFFHVSYFRDEAMTEKLTNPCYLNYGDKIYAQVEVKNENSSSYGLESFRVVRNGEDPSVYIKTDINESGFVFEIPNESSIKSLLIFPVGEYKSRSILLEVINAETGVKLYSAGTWFSNSKEIDGTKPFVVEPTESYSLRFAFDKDNWFYVNSDPTAYTPNANEVGFVEFKKINPTDQTGFDVFTVELHRYFSLNIQVPKNNTEVIVNGKKVELDTKWYSTNAKLSLDKLKYGDIIKIETSGTVLIKDGDYRAVIAKRDDLGNGKSIYSLTITPDLSDNVATRLLSTGIEVERLVKVKLLSDCKYGRCSFVVDGKEVSGTVYIKEGSILKMHYQITQEGCSFTSPIVKRKLKADDSKVVVDMGMNGTAINPDDYFTVNTQEDE